MKNDSQEIKINALSTKTETVYLLPNGKNKIVIQTQPYKAELEAAQSSNSEESESVKTLLKNLKNNIWSPDSFLVDKPVDTNRSTANTGTMVGSVTMCGYVVDYKQYIYNAKTYPSGYVIGGCFPILCYPIVTVNLAHMAQLGKITSAAIKFTTTPNANAKCVMRKFNNGTVGEIVSYENNGQFDLTPIISSAVNGSVELCIVNENPLAVQYFSGNDNDDVNSRPVLSVTYIPFEAALQGQEYLETQAGEIACNIDILTGIPYISRPLLNFGGLKMPLNLSLNYNTENLSDGFSENAGFPKGWLTNYNQYCVADAYTDNVGNTKKYYSYIDNQGKKHIFRYAQNSSDLWVDSQGTGLLLQEVSNGTEIFDEDGNYMLFDFYGRLTSVVTKISDTATAETNISYANPYSSKIASITDGMGRRVTFDYSGSTIKISYEDLEKVKLVKDSSNHLSQIIRMGGSAQETDNFTTDSNGKVTAITAANGDTLNLTYEDFVRLSKIYILQTDKTYNFTYSFLQTTIVDNKGITQIYNFDENGEIMNSYEDTDDSQSGIRLVDRDSCQYYSGKLFTNSYNTFVFGSIPAKELKDVNTPMTLMPSKSVICDNVSTRKFAVFSARVNVKGAYKETETEDSYIRIEMWDSLSPSNKLCELEFNPFIEGVQVAATPFVTILDRDQLGHQLNVKIHINCRAANIQLFGLCIGPMNSTVNRLCYNYNLGYGAYPDNILYYYLSKNSGVTFNSDVEVDDDNIVLQYEDYLANAKNYQTRNNGTWNFWYDRKRKMVAGVSSAIVKFQSGYTFDFSQGSLTEISVDNSDNFSAIQKTYSNSSNYFLEVYEVNSNDVIGTKYSYSYYDSVYNLIKSRNNQTITENTYDSNGYQTKSVVSMNDTPAYSINTKYTYTDNYLTSEENCRSYTKSTSKYAYDKFGNVSKITAPNEFETYYTFDTFGDRLEQVSGTISGSVNKNDITYTNGKVTGVAHNGFNYDFGYDNRNNLNSIKIANTQYMMKNYTYTDNTDTVLTQYGNGMYAADIYDKYNRLVGKDTSVFIYATPTDEEELEAVYAAVTYNSSKFPINSNSLLYKIIDKYYSSTTKYEYNILNSVTSATETLPNESKLCYNIEYDDRNLPNTVTYSYNDSTIQKLTFTYRTDSLQASSEVKSTTTKCGKSTYVTATDKDKLNRISSESSKFGYFTFTKSYEYYSDNLSLNGTTNCVKSYTLQMQAFNATNTYSTDAFEYDKNYNITKQTTTRSGNTYVTAYAYDAYNRLTRENNQALGKTYTYEYDAGGNITRKREYSYTAGTLGSATNTYNYTYGNAMKDRLTVWNGKSFSYDNCGNPTTYKDDTLTWTRGRLLSSYTKDGTKYSFTYDVNGIRRRKATVAGHTEYLVSDGNLVEQNYYVTGMSVPIQNIVFLYAHNGIIGCVINDVAYLYEKDIYGNVIGLWAEMALAARYEYDAWGNCKVLNPNGTENTDANFVGNINPIRYRSYYFDTDLDLYYLQTRWYDPETGRFINLDQIQYIDPESLNGLNLYAYCLNNPVMGVDPDGTIAILIAILLTIAAFAVDTAVETTILMTSEQYKAENVVTRNADGISGVQIKNSAAFNNPIAQYVYANYLYNNVKNDDGTNFFTGDVYDIIGEWQAHNLAAQLTGLGMVLTAIPSGVLGSGNIYNSLYKLHKSSVHVDLGNSLVAEKRSLVRGVSQFYKWINKIFSLNILNWWS